MTGWIVVAIGFVGIGLGAIAGAQTVQGWKLAPDTVREWRRYASEVEGGTRTPSGITTRLLTETAIAQQAHARAAAGLLRLMGAGVALLGVILAVDLIRYRARYAGESATQGTSG
jgi:hypothetical protein